MHPHAALSHPPCAYGCATGTTTSHVRHASEPPHTHMHIAHRLSRILLMSAMDPRCGGRAGWRGGRPARTLDVPHPRRPTRPRCTACAPAPLLQKLETMGFRVPSIVFSLPCSVASPISMTWQCMCFSAFPSQYGLSCLARGAAARCGPCATTQGHGGAIHMRAFSPCFQARPYDPASNAGMARHGAGRCGRRCRAPPPPCGDRVAERATKYATEGNEPEQVLSRGVAHFLQWLSPSSFMSSCDAPRPAHRTGGPRRAREYQHGLPARSAAARLVSLHAGHTATLCRAMAWSVSPRVVRRRRCTAPCGHRLPRGRS